MGLLALAAAAGFSTSQRRQRQMPRARQSANPDLEGWLYDSPGAVFWKARCAVVLLGVPPVVYRSLMRPSTRNEAFCLDLCATPCNPAALYALLTAALML